MTCESVVLICWPEIRRVALICWIIAISIYSNSLSAADCLAPPSGIIGWWQGEGGASDYDGTNNGILQGGANANSTGIVGTAFSFNGTNDFVRIADSPQFHLTNLTVEAWVRFASMDSAGSGGSPAGEQYIVFKQNTRSNSFEGFDLGKERVGTTNAFRFIVSSASGQSATMRSSTALATGVWYHVAAVRGTNFTQLFVNGHLERQTNVAFAQDYGSLPLFFGSSGQASWDHKFKGTMDEVSLYNRALTTNEIAAIYSAGAAGKCSTPHFLVAPTNESVAIGTSAILSVTASGTQPLKYQWLLNSELISQATNATLTLTNVQPGDAGLYVVVLTNVAGAVTSPPALLTVATPPVLTLQPIGATDATGSAASFTAGVAGAGPLNFQWRFNGTNLFNDARIKGANSNQLVITSLKIQDAGSYDLQVSNIAGNTTSAVATLIVADPPLITLQPGSMDVLVGENVNFAVGASGSGALNYQWYKNGNALTNDSTVSGATTSTLSLLDVQTNDAASFTVVVTNTVGSVTSLVATLSVTETTVPPSIVIQPANQSTKPGSNVVFSVAANGTDPLAYRWQKDGQDLTDSGVMVGSDSAMLQLTGVNYSNAGSYRVAITNAGGAVTSTVAALTVPTTLRTEALVLVNSSSAKYLDFQRFIQPYLDNFGVPYVVFDIATNSPGSQVSDYSLILIGHKQLDTNHLHLDLATQANISAAISNGVGLVNFDGDLFTAGGAQRYQFAQDIFAFGYGGSGSNSTVVLPTTEPSSQMHFITALHKTNEVIALRSNLTMPALTLASDAKAIALSGTGRALLAVKKFGQGRAVHFTSYDWMTVAVLGPVSGLDDLLWRSLVWAARKPFVMRGLPNFVTLRVDDVEGPLWWVKMANDVGFNPFLAVFIGSMPRTNAIELRSFVTNHHASASVHAFTGSSFVYFNHQLGTNYSDTAVSNNLYAATQWHITNGIPFSKTVIAHYDEIGPNAFAGLLPWGIEYLPIQVVPGTVEYATNGAPWLMAGPYRRYETPGAGQSTLPLFYADNLTIPGHPELNGKFFNVCTEIRDLGNSCAEWCPNNDVATTITRGTSTLKRALDSLTLATLFTHEWYIHPTTCCGSTAITSNNWRAILQGITNNLAAYKPIFVTLDYGNQYIRATRTSRISSSEFDGSSGQVKVLVSGKADLETSFQVYQGIDQSISNLTVAIPAFTNSIGISTLTLGLSPAVVQAPVNRTNNAFTDAAFSVVASGNGALSYRWFRNGVQLQDNGHISGAAAATLSLANVLGADAGLYTVVVSNVFGSVTSSPPAILRVVDPYIVLQPVSRTNHAGTDASFSVRVMGTAPSYQWFKNSAIIDQATNAFLVLFAVSGPDAGVYSVLVSNFYGSLSSSPAGLTVASPLLINSVSVSNNLAAVGWFTIPGSAYVLQQNDLLGVSNWTPSGPIIQATGITTSTAVSVGGSTQRFFRVFLMP